MPEMVDKIHKECMKRHAGTKSIKAKDGKTYKTEQFCWISAWGVYKKRKGSK